MATALVTGGTAGIGNAFAVELASLGYDLVLVARDGSRLESVADELRRDYGVSVETLRADLGVREDVLAVRDRLVSVSDPIDMLINNAGFGLNESLLVADFSIQENAIDVMCIAVFILGGAAGRAMQSRGTGTIINVGSTSGLIMKGNYSAIKAWVNSYSQALGIELAPSGVKVTTLMPGWVRTEFHERAQVTISKLPGFLWLDAKRLVKEALADAFKGKAVSIPSKRYKIIAFVARMLPLAALRAVSAKLAASRRR